MTDSCPNCAHTEASHERMRTSTRNSLLYHADMLDNALHALNNGSPHVTHEFLTRAVSSMRQAADGLTFEEPR